MTRSEFRKKVIELLNRYKLNGSMKEKILPLFSILDNLSQDEIVGMYAVLEEAIVTHQETEKLTEKLKHIYNDFNNAIQDVSRKLAEIKERLDYLKRPSNKYLKDNSKPKLGNAMGYNKQSFPGEKPNFGLKLNKLFSSYITEYGPEYITMVISDSILYTNNLILRICLKTRDVLIGSSKSLKLYETKSGSFLITDKPEVIPYGNSAGFHFKYITYEDILNLTNGDFYKVFTEDIVHRYKKHEIVLPEELKEVGYYPFE
ncbi:MAG: hypothetical protein AMS17_09285 [Spirochaetes bacterium DG_61]|jgi:hypothetical protein|nr:MAG: hypothetical protein AMS17_09285 [Spirochaetes bacterium DG_61]